MGFESEHAKKIVRTVAAAITVSTTLAGNVAVRSHRMIQTFMERE